MKKFILRNAPVFLQNAAITIYNCWLYRKRHGGAYAEYVDYYRRFDSASAQEVDAERDVRAEALVRHANANSSWYARFGSKKISDFPVLEKEELLENLGEISTIEEKSAEVSLTGGTTGASMKVLYTRNDIQDRNAILDYFRSQHGYQLGMRTAWFSGKDLVREKDLAKGLCYRDDWVNNIRFFSTFHISERNFEAYWDAFTRFAPKFIVGFPSSVLDLCSMALDRGLSFKGCVEVFFPTAETVLPRHRDVIGKVLGCRLVDQYASSEGAPFILECAYGALHIHPLTGIFEVVDSDLQPANEGEILVTSFSTYGTPLIRYRIGDRVKLAQPNRRCACGSVFPIVEYIDGRNSDFLWSPENGRVNLGNISNCTKDAPGIICFQARQDAPYQVNVKIVRGKSFLQRDRESFVAALQSRLGKSVSISLDYVDDIPRENSGKFRIVKNMLCEQQMSSVSQVDLN